MALLTMHLAGEGRMVVLVRLMGSLVAPIHLHTTQWMVVVRNLVGSMVVMHLVGDGRDGGTALYG